MEFNPEIYMLGFGIILFCSGLLLVLSRKHAIMVLMGIELMLNASNINFVVFNRLHPDSLDGQMAVIFVMLIAAAEVAVALAIILNLYRNRDKISLDDLNKLKEE